MLICTFDLALEHLVAENLPEARTFSSITHGSNIDFLRRSSLKSTQHLFHKEQS